MSTGLFDCLQQYTKYFANNVTKLNILILTSLSVFGIPRRMSKGVQLILNSKLRRKHFFTDIQNIVTTEHSAK